MNDNTPLAAELKALSDSALVEFMANEMWWESQYPDDDVRVERSAACKDEATRRGKPALYLKALDVAMGKDD
jgi:hypothetical protein